MALVAPEAHATDLLAIVRTLPDVVFRCTKDRRGRIIWTLNEGRLAEEFHLTTRDVYGKSLEELFPPDVAARQRPFFEAAFEGKTVEWVNEMGGRLFKHHPQPVFDARGKVEAVVGFITEVTSLVAAQREAERLNAQLSHRMEDLARTNERLANANRDLDGFAAAVAHDLRQPLSALAATAYTLERRVQEDPKSADLARRVAAIAARMEELTSDLLRFSRASQTPLAMARLDVSLLATEALAQLRARDPERQVQVHVAPGLSAWGDAGLARVVLDNLLANAWKYTGKAEHPRIDVRAVPVAGRMGIEVADNGIGFADGTGLFQPFRRLPGSEAFPGTGMGLATLRRIVERHGGAVEADSRPGHGARFRFTLAPPPPPAGAAAS